MGSVDHSNADLCVVDNTCLTETHLAVKVVGSELGTGLKEDFRMLLLQIAPEAL
jgi:hypothetical protein